MLEMGTRRAAKIVKLGNDEEHDKALFCGLNKSVKKGYPLQVGRIV